jgi:beta-lactamase superfamily II metal-dependent hydrolase
MIRTRLAFVLLGANFSPLLTGQTGVSLDAWKPGTLEIHHISTGRGNSTLFILPDATTILVDAGAANGGADTAPHPDGSRSPGDWIARYIKRHLPIGVAALDYVLITHFHSDHYGQVMPDSPLDRTRSYQLTGVTEVAEAIPIHTLLDRGWPDYSYPTPLQDETVANYRLFVKAQMGRGMSIEQFRPGSSTQIKLRNDAARYPGFMVRNIAGNGEMWTGRGIQTRRLFPKIAILASADLPTENMCSLAIRIQYGKFRYFTGGDLPGGTDPGFPAWNNLENQIAPVVGPVDVHVVNQHGSMGEESEAFLRELKSRVLIVPSWAPSHPAPDVLKRMINSRLPPSPRYIFATDLRESARTVIGQRATQLSGPPGHIVVRVQPDGQYQVFVLENHDEGDSVVASIGPLTSGGEGTR